MAIIKCKMCGGDLNIIEGASTAECEFCGSVQTVPKVDDEKKLTLFARANRLRVACDFDKAAGIYEAIVADFPEEAEAYWGLVLCKYGIEYVDDPATGKKIPTCHRSSFDSIMDDGDLEQALENADTTAQKVYREEAKQFERIRKGILEVSSTEKPYDIFICYKETAENGDRTLDSVLAQDLYGALTDKGYRVFFSRITLQGKLGEAYEPYIFAALNSAKVMLAVGTCYEYYNAVWVKNEWSRYLKLCQADKSKHLIPCYKDLDPEDMPKEFNHLQGADLGKMGAVQDILFNMEKYIPLKKETTTVIHKESAAARSSNPTVDSYLKRAFMFLEDGDWNSAKEYCEKVLDINPENAHAYLGELLAELNVHSPEQLRNQKTPFDNQKTYQKAIRFADDELRRSLTDHIDAIKQRNEEARIARLKREEEERIARLKREEEAQIERENKRKVLIEKLHVYREKIRPVQNIVRAGCFHVVAVNTDRTLSATKYLGDANLYGGQCDIADWRDIIAVETSLLHTVGLRSDGTVVATRYIGQHQYNAGQCNTSRWTNISAISTGVLHTVGLRTDGTVVAVGDNQNKQCDVSNWKDIIAISAGSFHTLGLKSDGTVVATGLTADGRCNVDKWQDIIAISAGKSHSVGLKSDGSVVATKYTGERDGNAGQCDVSNWQNIVAICADDVHTIGLKSDGTVVATGYNGDGRCDVSKWRNIISISTGGHYSLGLTSNGKIVTTKYTGKAGGDCGQFAATQWCLFNSLDNLEQERASAYAKRTAEDRITKEKCQRRNAGLCQHCGGELKGFFSKKCVSCGKPKDY